MRAVKGEEARFNFGNGKARNGTGKFFREYNFLMRICILHNEQTISQLQRCLNGICKTIANVIAHNQTVDDDFNVMLIFLIQIRHFIQLVNSAIDTGALKSFGLKVCKFALIFALATSDNRRHQVKSCAIPHLHNAVHHFRHGLAGDGFACRRGVGNTHTRPEEAHIIMDLCDRSNCGAWIF